MTTETIPLQFKSKERGKETYTIETKLRPDDCEVILAETTARILGLALIDDQTAKAQFDKASLTLEIVPKAGSTDLEMTASYNPDYLEKPPEEVYKLAGEIKDTIFAVAKEYEIELNKPQAKAPAKPEPEYIHHNDLSLRLDNTSPDLVKFTKPLTPGKSIIYWHRKEVKDGPKIWVTCVYEGIDKSGKLTIRQISHAKKTPVFLERFLNKG